MNARQMLSRFTGVKKLSGSDLDRWIAHCPAHKDNTQSLQIAQGDKGVLLKCHAGCDTQAIIGALALTMKDLFAENPPPESAPAPVKGNPVYKGEPQYTATFDYCDTDGTLLYQVVRMKPGPDGKKKFMQRRPDGDGGWIWKVAKQVKRVPYRLPDLLAHSVVFVVEGEKDADRLWTMDIAATCNAGGAGKWGASESKALAAACVERVIVIPDNDDPGRKHAEDVAAKCKKVGLAVSVVELDGLGHHGDVSDWLNSGGTRDGLLALAAVPYVLPSADKKPVPAGYSGPVTAPMPGAGVTVPAGAGAVELGPAAVEVHTDDDLGPIPVLADPTKYGSAHGDGVPYDVGAAEAFRDRYGDRVRYDHTTGQWFLWTGNYWRADATELVRGLAIHHVRRWREETAKALHYPKRAALMGFLLKLDRRTAIDNMLTCATWLQPISTDGKLWNKQAMRFGARNGVIDLATGALAPGHYSEFITHVTSYDYDPQAQCPRWEQFIKEVFEDDLSLMIYVQRAVGYSLTADMREQAFFMCVGTGANGKSIFLDTLEWVFGDYAHRANMMVFTGDAAKFHIAEMQNRRLIVASETKPNTRLNEHILKDFTGGESQSAERKNQQPFTFKPVGKIWMGVNHEPKVTDDSFGFWRRVRLIPFLRTFSGANDDRNLREKLSAEAPGILRWCIEGCLDWQTFGLPAPAKVTDATTRYQQQENPLAEFFAEKCRLDEDATTSTSALIAAYTTWCDDQGIRAYDRMPRRMILTQLEKQFTIVNIAGHNRVKGIDVLDTGNGLF